MRVSSAGSFLLYFRHPLDRVQSLLDACLLFHSILYLYMLKTENENVVVGVVISLALTKSYNLENSHSKIFNIDYYFGYLFTLLFKFHR